jgi:hypothetical protein
MIAKSIFVLIGGRGIALDVHKMAARQRQKERRAVKAQFKVILEKDKVDEKDYPAFFLGMTAKQKQTLALIGLASLMGRFFRNPKRVLAELNRIRA